MYDYTQLMGKIIDCPYNHLGVRRERKALVAAIDPHIGVTLVNAADNDEYFSCLRCPGSPQWKSCGSVDRAMATFYCLARMIINDSYSAKEVDDVYRAFSTPAQKAMQDLFGETTGGNPAADTCAF